MNKKANILMRRCVCTLLCCISASAALRGQSVDTLAERSVPAKSPLPGYEMREVRGRVVDSALGKGMDGVRVGAFGNPRYSTLSDSLGNYTLRVPLFVTSLYISVPEYSAVQVAIAGRDQLPDTRLYRASYRTAYTDATTLQSAQKATIDLSSAVTVDDEIERQLGGDIRTIRRTSLTGQGAALFIHGLNSLNLNSQPLIILDGMMLDMQLDRESLHTGFFSNILAGIDPGDIESVEVLKNATSIYGARGANGVILINTKRGHSMATKIDVSLSAGFELAPSYTKMMNASQYRNYLSDLIGTTTYGQQNGTASASIPFLNDNPDYYWYPLYHNDTDWSDGLYRTAATQNYKVGVQGGDDVAMYNLSLGYTNAQSTAKENAFNRLNIRFNTDINLMKDLSTQLDVAYSRSSYNLRDNGWAETYDGSTISSPNVLGLIQSPFLSKYAYYTGDDLKLHLSSVYAGKYYDDDNYPFAYASKYGANTALANPYWILTNGDGTNKNHQEVTQFNLNIRPKWDINSHLSLENRFAYQLNRTSEKYYLPEAGIPQYTLTGLGDVTSLVRSFFGKETGIYEDLSLHWHANYGAHDVSALGGFRFTNYTYTNSYISGYNSGNDKMPDMKNGLQFRSADGTNDEWRNMAYYLQADYSLRQTYYAQLTMSAEASSRFGHETSEGVKLFGVKWGVFPSLQLGWVMTNEPWMRWAKAINHLKLRVGYDESGNDAIPYSASRTYFQSSEFLKEATALQLKNIENPEIQWETTRRLSAGADVSFFNNRLQASIDIYSSTTSNLLTLKQNNYLTGLSSYWANDGKLRNTGIDAHLSGLIVDTKDWQWQVGVTLGHYKNEILSLPEGSYTTTIYDGEILTAEHHAAGLFYGYQTNGVFADEAEASTAYEGKDYQKYPTGIKSQPYKNFHAGDVRFVDRNNDGIINERDKTVIGDPNPDLYGNISTSLSYRRWTLSVNLKYSLGNDIYNYQRSRLESLSGFYNQTQAAVNRWSAPGQVTDMPRLCATTSDSWVDNERFSDRWIEDGSYLKLKTVRLAYQLPIASQWLQGLTVWAEGNNLFVLTHYLGDDPEVSCSNSVLYQGIDAGLLPTSPSFNLGVKINL